MTAAKPNPVTPRDIARIAFRHWRTMAHFFGGGVALTLLTIALYPRSYSSEAKLFIRVGRESVALDPTATTGQTITLQKSQVDEVNSALNILNSRQVLEQVVERVGAERILKNLPAGDAENSGSSSGTGSISAAAGWVSSCVDALARAVRLSDPGSDVDLAIRQLETGLTVWTPKQSTVINLTYAAGSPDLARDVVAATTDAFLEEHLRLSQTVGSYTFFSEQASALHNDLTAAQTALRDRKNAFQTVSRESRRTILDEQIQNVELELLRSQRDLASSDAKIADLTRAIASLAPEVVTNRVAGHANEAKDGMREKLYELEVQESELKSRYTAEYPLLVEIQRQRQDAQEILTHVPDDRTQTTAALNSNQRKLEFELLQAKANAEAIRGRQSAAQTQQAKLRTELQTINDQELELSQLERNVDLLEGKYRMHVEKLEQARVNDALGRDGITNVMVAQPASLVGKPVAPKKRLVLALGLILATGGALGLAFLRESLDQTLQTTDQVEAHLGLPVLLSFPFRNHGRANASTGAPAGAEGVEQNGHDQFDSYRALARGLLPSGAKGDRRARTIGVVGCDASELGSQVAADLAIQAARSGGDPVLLIDADSRLRRVSKRFQLNGSPGWREVLAGIADTQSCIHRPNIANLAILGPGGTNGDDSAAQPAVGAVGQLDDIKTDYGLVVVDLPPAGELDAPPPAVQWLDEIVLVVDAERTRIQAAQHAKEVLQRAGATLTGVVLANRREHIPRWLYKRL